MQHLKFSYYGWRSWLIHSSSSSISGKLVQEGVMKLTLQEKVWDYEKSLYGDLLPHIPMLGVPSDSTDSKKNIEHELKEIPNSLNRAIIIVLNYTIPAIPGLLVLR